MGKDNDICEGTNQEGNAGAATPYCRALYTCWAKIQQCLLELESESSEVLEDFISTSRSKEKFPAIPEPLRNSVSACGLSIRKAKSLAIQSCALMTRLLDEQASSENIRQGVASASQMCAALYQHTGIMDSRISALDGLLDECEDKSAKQSCGILQTEVSARLQALIQLRNELEELCISTSLEMEKKYPSPVVPPEENQRRASVLEGLKHCVANNYDELAAILLVTSSLCVETKTITPEPETQRAILAILQTVEALCDDMKFKEEGTERAISMLNSERASLDSFGWKCKVHTLATANPLEGVKASRRYIITHLNTIANMLLSTPEGDRRDQSYIDNFVRPILEKNEKLTDRVDIIKCGMSKRAKLCQEESGLEDYSYTPIDATEEDSEEEPLITLPSRLQERTDTTGEDSEEEPPLPSKLQERTDTTGEDSEKETRVIPSRRPWQERAKATFVSFFASFVIAAALLPLGIVVAAIYLLYFPLYVISIFGILLFSAVHDMAGTLLYSPVEEGVEHVSSPVEERVERVARDTDEPGNRTNHCKTAAAYSLAIALVVVTSPILLLLAIALSILAISQVIFRAAVTIPFKEVKWCYNECMEEFEEKGVHVDHAVWCIQECIPFGSYTQFLYVTGEKKARVCVLLSKHFSQLWDKYKNLSPESNLENTDVSVVTENTEREICP